MAFQANFKGLNQVQFARLIQLPMIFCRQPAVGGGLVERLFLRAQATIDFCHQIPIKTPSQARTWRDMADGFSDPPFFSSLL